MGIACLSLGEIFPPMVGVLLVAGLLACMILEIKGILPLEPLTESQLPKWGLLLLPLVFMVVDMEILDFVSCFLTFLLFTRFMFKSELNDYLFGYLLSISCLLIGAIYIRDVIYGLLFLAFYLVLCWSFILYNMMVEHAGSHSPPSVFKHIKEKDLSWTPLFSLSAGLVFVSLLLTAVIFISFPRIGLGLISLNPKARSMTGFSQTVTLGDVGKIKENESVVMRVEYRRGDEIIRPSLPAYWRGIALDHYNGKSWTSKARMDWATGNQTGVGTRVFTAEKKSDLVRQEVYMESFDNKIIFTHGLPIIVDGNFKEIQLDESFVLRTGRQHSGPKRFSMISDINNPVISNPVSMPQFNPRVFPRRYLQLPPLSIKIQQLARTLTIDSDSPRDNAYQILKYLKTGFGYTLETEQPPQGSALDHFLFTRKKGHCEYFASSMVVLLRLANIPSRIVNGFLADEWNGMGNYLIVRQKNAHSWVEAYFPETGWVIFDPTPADPALADNSKPSSLARAMDLLRMNWQRYIIRYSMNDQLEIMKFFRSKGERAVEKVKFLGQFNHWVQSIKSQPWLIPLALTVLAVLFLLRSKLPRFSFGTRPPFAVSLYREMVARLKKNGFEKSPHQTHRELLKHLGPLPQEKQGRVRKVTAFYEKSRFANQPAGEQEEKEMQNTVRQI
jgi:transglutaminase-like putative cysteine protease